MESDTGSEGTQNMGNTILCCGPILKVMKPGNLSKSLHDVVISEWNSLQQSTSLRLDSSVQEKHFLSDVIRLQLPQMS